MIVYLLKEESVSSISSAQRYVFMVPAVGVLVAFEALLTVQFEELFWLISSFEMSELNWVISEEVLGAVLAKCIL